MQHYSKTKTSHKPNLNKIWIIFDSFTTVATKAIWMAQQVLQLTGEQVREPHKDKDTLVR